MALDTEQARQRLQNFDFAKLFINELGWDRPGQNVSIKVGADAYQLDAVAQKRGVQIFHCLPDAGGKIPEYSLRRKIDQQAAKTAQEHLLIFSDAKKTTQVWQWMSKEDGKAAAVHQQPFYARTSGDALLQKLDRITFSLADEERLTLTGVTFKLKDAFYKERLTKNFYKVFEQQHKEFVAFIGGIPDGDLQKWYASVMINRLMFLYFIQEKGFLDGDKTYLQDKLGASRGRYYKSFLCPLFFEGFAMREGERSAETNALLGRVPYLNGGLFAKHQIEARHGQDIDIPDAAFQKLFAFFDAYDWRLDDRPSASGTEINPDVLGYIFEKYINQKQMGAYYTKEDITEYIGKNTILPFLFDQTRRECAIAFDGAHSLWHLLSDDPDRYVYPAVKHGVTEPLPAVIAKGVENVAERGEWNKPAPADYALPTEIWREVVARRQRYEAVRDKLAAGEVRDINDLITYNLNIRQFAQDCIEQWEGADFLRAFWAQIRTITVLDPTCGSGAFLFAALEILEPLYEACLDRMEAFVADANQLGRAKDYHDFRQTLAEVARHPNRSYFIYKSIIVNNLYGVDIMEEATEICKLRLFLKLAAQIEPDPSRENFGVEPLPDIDFNIRAGNTLVGFATEEQTRRAFTSKLDIDDAWGKITQKAKVVEGEFEKFQKSQTDTAEASSEYARQMKQAILSPLTELRNELDRALALQYGKVGKESMATWLKTAQPFHWFIEFFGVMKRGGFDAIIGNPPYVEYAAVKTSYLIRSFDTESSGNLFAFVMERADILLRAGGRTGMIVPHSAICTDRMEKVIKVLETRKQTWLSTYDIRPAKLFVGVDQRLLIYISRYEARSESYCQSTQYHRWNEEVRTSLFTLLQYVNISDTHFHNSLPKIHTVAENDLWKRLTQFAPLSRYLALRKGNATLYFHNAPRYWVRAMDFAPYFWNERNGEQLSTQVKQLSFSNVEDTAVAVAALNSSVFYWWFVILSDCRHLNLREIEAFPLGVELMSQDTKKALSNLADELMVDLKKHANRKDCVYKTTGVSSTMSLPTAFEAHH